MRVLFCPKLINAVLIIRTVEFLKLYVNIENDSTEIETSVRNWFTVYDNSNIKYLFNFWLRSPVVFNVLICNINF